MTRTEKINFIINELERLKGLEFIEYYEIDACNVAQKILRKEINTKKKKHVAKFDETSWVKL